MSNTNNTPEDPSPDPIRANTPESNLNASTPDASQQASPNDASAAQYAPDPREYARMLVKAPGNNLQNAEDYARAHERGLQGGEREKIAKELADNEKQAKHHKSEARKARRCRNRQHKTMPSKSGGRKMPWWAKALFVATLLFFAGGLFAEHYGASAALCETGAFNIHSIGQGMMMTATAIVVGVALKLAHRKFSPAVQQWSFYAACIALLALVTIWAWNFATEVNLAGKGHELVAQLQDGESIGDGGDQLAPIGDGSVDADKEGHTNSKWGMFFTYVGLMVTTTFVAWVALESSLAAYEAHVPNPEYYRAQDDMNVHLGAMRQLSAEEGVLEQRLAQLSDRENSAAAAARAEYLNAINGRIPGAA